MGIIGALLILGARPAVAGFGVSPSDIIVPAVKPGTTFVREFVVSRSEANEDVEVIIEPALESMAAWFKFEPGMKFVIPAGQQRYTFKAVIRVPAAIPVNTYSGLFRLKATPVNQNQIGGVAVVMGARIDVALNVTDKDVTGMIVRSMELADVNDGEPLKMRLLLENTGSIDQALSRVSVTISDLNGNLMEELEATVLPVVKAKETKRITVQFNTSVEEGEYFGLGKAFLGTTELRSERMVFRVKGTPGLAALEIDPKQGAGGFLTSSRSMGMGLLILGFFLLAIMGVVELVRQWRVIGKHKKKKLHPRTIYVILGIGGVAVIVAGTVMLLTQKPEVPEPVAPAVSVREQAVEEPVEVGEEGISIGEVQGLTTESIPVAAKPEFKPVVVTSPKLGNGYPIYERPDYGSELVLMAIDGQSFEVLDENSNWYRVELPDQRSGWIPKTSIKAVE
jgi:hypothetical protein